LRRRQFVVEEMRCSRFLEQTNRLGKVRTRAAKNRLRPSIDNISFRHSLIVRQFEAEWNRASCYDSRLPSPLG
jgi:hypothetical protein